MRILTTIKKPRNHELFRKMDYTNNVDSRGNLVYEWRIIDDVIAHVQQLKAEIFCDCSSNLNKAIEIKMI
jgi:signal transduction histidine kinase